MTCIGCGKNIGDDENTTRYEEGEACDNCSDVPEVEIEVSFKLPPTPKIKMKGFLRIIDKEGK